MHSIGSAGEIYWTRISGGVHSVCLTSTSTIYGLQSDGDIYIRDWNDSSWGEPYARSVRLDNIDVAAGGHLGWNYGSLLLGTFERTSGRRSIIYYDRENGSMTKSIDNRDMQGRLGNADCNFLSILQGDDGTT